jgi:hypothetical protein
MKNQGKFQFFLRLAIVPLFAGALFAQSTPDKILVVNGKTIGPAVREMDGHSYVDIDTLAQAVSGNVTVEPNRVLLAFPMAVATTAPVAAPTPSQPSRPAPQVAQGLSRGFAAAAIGSLAEMREWRGATTAMITYGMAVSDALAESYRDQVQEGLAQAGVAAVTDDDRNALGLLQGESAQLGNWASTVLAARRELNGKMTVDPNALQNDSALAKIQTCGQFLNSMLVSGAFADDASCH